MKFVSSLTSLHHSLFLLLLIAGVSTATNCRHSCGKLHNITYPLRLRGDPPDCGQPEYELVCQDDQAPTLHLFLDRHDYVVTGVSGGDGSKFQLSLRSDCPFTTNTCRINNDTSSPQFSSPATWYRATFLNCSQRIVNDSRYTPVPSLSQENTTVYIVVGDEFYLLTSLHQSCSFLDTFISGDSSYRWPSRDRFIDRLRSGFQLTYWYGREESCWAYAFRFAKVDIPHPNVMEKILYPFRILDNFLDCITTNANENSKLEYSVLAVIRVILYFTEPGLLALAILRRFVLPPVVILVFILYNYRKNTKPVDTVEKFLREHQVLGPRRYDYGEIVAITRHFREKLGKGGFGSVYKGELLGGHHVAVKVLEGSKFNGDDFINEVATIGRIHHVNIVQLLGFCSDGTKRALIYEYMPNGSLEKYLFASGENIECPLTLEELNNIALGIAKGLHYLHTGCDMQILHFDIKPHNILLDADFTPKLSDFGLARLCPKEKGIVSMSAARGTIGYIAPEVISRNFGAISYKSDVYSFGMLLLEIAGRRRNVDTREQNSSRIYYPSWIYDNLSVVEEPNFDGIIEVGELERKLCKIGLWCIQMNSSKRPSMGEVVEFLRGNADDIEMPPKPFFSAVG